MAHDNFDERLFRAHVVARLMHIADLFASGVYEEIQKYTFESPAGDGYGEDSVCINFAFGDEPEEPYYKRLRYCDISDAIERIRRLEAEPDCCPFCGGTLPEAGICGCR